MLDEKLQFALSQYADGTLPPAERPALEKLLAENAAARQLLEEYRRLDALLVRAAVPPAISWERFSQAVSAAIQEPPATYPIWAYRPVQLALAASVLIAIGLAVLFYRGGGMTLPATPAGIALVQVITPAAPVGEAVAEISIGPSPLAEAAGMGEDTAADAPRAVIAAGVRPLQDGDWLY